MLLFGALTVGELLQLRGVMLAGLLAAGSVASPAAASTLPLKPTLLEDAPLLAPADEAPITASLPPVEGEPSQTLPKKRVVENPYAPQGLAAGGLRLFPSLELSAIASSNAAQRPGGSGDTGVHFKPSLRFDTDWSRHRWTGSASADFLNYFSAQNSGSTSAAANTDFRLDIRHTTHADFSVDYASSQTALSDVSLPGNAAAPRRDQNIGLGAALVHDFGGLEGSIKLALARSIFDDVPLVGGGAEINSDRNYVEPSLSLRAALGDSGTPLKPFAEISYAPRIHDQAVDRNGQARNSQGVGATLGFVLDDGPIWVGDMALTYLVRNYADPALAANSALGMAGHITWRPTELLSFDGTSSVGLGETETAGIGGTKTWKFGLDATYGMRENVDLVAGIGLGAEATGVANTLTKTAKLGVDWTLNPNMVAGVTYQGTWYADGTALGSGDYSEQQLLTSIVVRR